MNTTARLQKDLLDWYEGSQRMMPWRAPKGRDPNPYHVWLSEIMLQQTTVAAVKPYFEKFIACWPDLESLAAAQQDDVLRNWAGLGYYARARNLHACAKMVFERYNGIFPADYEALRALPGIGPYTAAAIASIAFGLDYTAVDGNVERVVARFYAINAPLPVAKPELKDRAEKLGKGNARPADFTQAFMELGATICTPKSPKCGLCPWKKACRGYASGCAEEFPLRLRRKQKPKKSGTVFWITNAQGEVLLRKRPETGLLGGMMEFPSSEWSESKTKKAVPPVPAAYKSSGGEDVKHVFTHFELSLNIKKYSYSGRLPDKSYKWVHISKLEFEALPSLMRKVIKLSSF